MEYTEEFLRKGHKKEDLIKIILDMQADHKEDRDMLVSQVDNQQKYIKELQSDIENRTSEYARWKEYNKDFLTRFMGEYMELHKDGIADAVADKIVSGLELTDKSWGDYYSSGTDVILTYKGRNLGSASVYQK